MSRLLQPTRSLCFLAASAASLLVFYAICVSKRREDSSAVLNVQENHDVWLIFTRVALDSPLRYKFSSLVRNLLAVSSVRLRLHVIVDGDSRKLAEEDTNAIGGLEFVFYNVTEVVAAMEDIVGVMKPHFSSTPGSYYSDALFYISLGLHRFAPLDQEHAILLDCDLHFKRDVALLFREFTRFKPSALFGLAPELSPVYRHALHRYRSKLETTFGESYNSTFSARAPHPLGFQGYNSGVVLLDLGRIRRSNLYAALLSGDFVSNATARYSFRGHLGDQDFYTLVGYERPELIQTLNCGFNRQLCTWWKGHGYGDVFDEYFKCEHEIVVLHGNCNTRIPDERKGV